MSTFGASPRFYQLFNLFDYFTIMSVILPRYISLASCGLLVPSLPLYYTDSRSGSPLYRSSGIYLG